MAVVIETTLGDITVDLYLDQRPVTCLNFLKLCKMKYYNFNLFHSIRSGFIAQTGDPTGEGSGGQSVFGLLEGPEKRFFSGEKMPKIRHADTGLLSMVGTGDMMIGSQFFFTLGPDLDSLDGVHCVIGEVTEGHEVLRKLSEVICDEHQRPYRDVRITHTVILEDPFNDPPGLKASSRSPSPSAERLKGGRIAPDEEIDETQGKSAAEVQEMIEEKEAKARATILEIVGDLPDADIAPPENVLFVCKLNPVTTDDDLEIIFSRFGRIVSCEVIRDKKTGDSLQYAFIEFADKKSCEDAYFKMDNVLIDDRRIHVDFSQSVSKMKWLGKGRGVKYFDDENKNDHRNSGNTRRSGSREKNRNDNHNSKSSNYNNKNNTDKHRGEHSNKYKKHERDSSKSSRKRSKSPAGRHKSKSYRDKDDNGAKNNYRNNTEIRNNSETKNSERSSDYKSNSSKYEDNYSKNDTSSKSHSSRSKDRKEEIPRDYKDKKEKRQSNRDTETRSKDRRNDRVKAHKHASDDDVSNIPKDCMSNRFKDHISKVDSNDYKTDHVSRDKKGEKIKDTRGERNEKEKFRELVNTVKDKTGEISTSSYKVYKNEKNKSSSDNERQQKLIDSKEKDEKDNRNIWPNDTKYKHSDRSRDYQSTHDRNDQRAHNEMSQNKNKDEDKDHKDNNNDKNNSDQHKQQKKRKHDSEDIESHMHKKSKTDSHNFEPRTPSPTGNSKKNKKPKNACGYQSSKKKNVLKKRRKPSTSTDSSSDLSSSSESSSSSDNTRKKKAQRRKKKHSTSSSSTSSSSGSSSSSSSSSTESSSSSSSSSDSDVKQKKPKKNSSLKKK